jgi:hypothetical protein
MNPPTRLNEAFRVPNSIVQSLTTTTDPARGDGTGLNRLTAFQTVTLLGLMTLLHPKHPQREVRTTPTELLGIVEVSRTVAQTVDRQWITADGEEKSRTYASTRYSPNHVAKVNDALRTLFDKAVELKRHSSETGARQADRVVHVLDSFGYIYEREGRELDLHDLPPGVEKVNIGSNDRPVWRLCSRTDRGPRFERARWICFRLNSELARELGYQEGTIGFTLFARKVFGLFRKHVGSPTMIRLIILVLRQTDRSFSRNITQLVADLGFDASHAGRAAGDLEAALKQLEEEHLITSFQLLPTEDTVKVEINREWRRAERSIEANP